MFDLSTFIIDRTLSGIMTDPNTGEVLWRVTQIEDPSINCSADEKTAVDAMGSTIATFMTAKTAEFTASNSLFDLNLAAAQFGSTKKIASAADKFVVPMTETFTVKGESNETVTLKHKPVGATGAEIRQIYELKGDSSLGIKYESGATPSATKFVLDAATGKITLPTGLTAGSQVFVMYDYLSENAVSVTNSATEFPKAGRFLLEVLGCDVCDTSTLYVAKILCDNALLTSNVDLSFTTDGKHPFTIKMDQKYCDPQKKLFSILIAE